MSTIENTRHVLAWVEAHPLPEDVSVHTSAHGSGARISLFAYDIDAMRDARRAVGTMEKTNDGQGMRLTAKIDGITFTVYPPDGTCNKVKVGERVEEVTKEVRPAETVTVEETVDVYEWDCGDVLVDAEVPA